MHTISHDDDEAGALAEANAAILLLHHTTFMSCPRLDFSDCNCDISPPPSALTVTIMQQRWDLSQVELTLQLQIKLVAQSLSCKGSG